MLLPTGCVLLKTIGAKTSPWRAKDRFFVPTLRVQVLGKDQREHEMKREGETRTGLGSGVWGLVRAEERKHETRKLGQTSGTRQSPFSREGDLGFLTSILLTLTSDPPRERSERLEISLNSPCSTHNRSQEHTPRRQEHSATPLERGFRSRAEERKNEIRRECGDLRLEEERGRDAFS